jgi:hypothetical protein
MKERDGRGDFVCIRNISQMAWVLIFTRNMSGLRERSMLLEHSIERATENVLRSCFLSGDQEWR